MHFLIYKYLIYTSGFKLDQSVFLAKDDVSTPVAFFKFVFVA